MVVDGSIGGYKKYSAINILSSYSLYFNNKLVGRL